MRKQEHRGFLRAGEDSPLTGTNYLWLFSDEPRPDHHAESFATLQAPNLKVGRAWAIKEGLRTLWTYRQPAAVTRAFSEWHGWAVRSRLDPVKKVAGMLKRHLDGVLRFVKRAAEGLNNKIMSIKRKAGGFRNPSNFTTAIYFHCRGLDLYTLIPEEAKNTVAARGIGPGRGPRRAAGVSPLGLPDRPAAIGFPR